MPDRQLSDQEGSSYRRRSLARLSKPHLRRARERRIQEGEANLVHPRAILGDYFADYAAQFAAIRDGRARGPLLPDFPELEKAIGGFIPPGLSIFHGPPGSGKSAFVGQIAAGAGCPALVVSLEMTFAELMHRHAARVTGEFIGHFRGHELAPSVWLSKMRRTIETLPLLRIVDATARPVSLDAVRVMAEATRGKSPHLLIVIDSLHSWCRRTQGSATQYDALGTLLTSFTVLAQELGASIVCVSEQNRNNRGSNGQDAATGSGAIEYVGELVVAIHRDPAPLDADGERVIYATLAKNRHGEEDREVKLHFCGRRMTFRESDDGGSRYASRNGNGSSNGKRKNA